MSPGARDVLRGVAWISPWLVGFAVFTLGPAVLSAVLSFCDYGLLDSAVWVGLDNYRELWGDPMFRVALRNTLVYASASAVLGAAVTLGVALLLERGLKGAALVRAIVFLPTLVPVVSACVCWMWLLNGRFGLVNQVLGWAGVEGPNWLGDARWAMGSLVVMSAWTIGGPVLVLGAAIRNVPRALYEAADLDGATGLRRFGAVTLPMVSPAVLFNGVMSVIWSLQVFGPPFIMTKGGPENATQVYAVYVYQNAFVYGRMGYACALAWVHVLATLVLTLGLLWVGRRVVYARGA